MNKLLRYLIIFTVLAVGMFLWAGQSRPSSTTASASIITAQLGSISSTLSSTGTVRPRNRLEVRPPVAGRLEQMHVSEGQQVIAGQLLATVSSTDRATLIDAARGQGAEELKYWQEVYRPIEIVAPMPATVIVATLQSGQVVATTDPIVVLADQLIVQATVDEADIGQLSVGQAATLTLDAYPDTLIPATVEHIYYEATTLNNVTVYKVDLLLQDTPAFLRSGMNAQVNFITQQKDNALLLPAKAVNISGATASVITLVHKKEVTLPVSIGLANEDFVEITQGITPSTPILLKERSLNLQAVGSGKNPFMPSRSPQKSSSSRPTP